MPVLKNPFTEAHDGKPTIEQTRHLAAFLHDGQKDHSGHDYIHHPSRVAQNVLRIDPNADDETLMIAYLHDTIEDCSITDNDLRSWGYSEAVIQGVAHVTKPLDDTRPYDQVIDDLIATGDRRAMLVKLADNMDNLHPARRAELLAINPEKSARLSERYEDSVVKLANALDMDAEHVFNAIENSPPIGLNASMPLERHI